MTMSCHCELILAMYLYQQKDSFRLIEIERFKKLCWLCQQYVKNIFQIEKLRVIIPEDQRKIHSDWLMLFSAINTQIRNLIESEFYERRENVMIRRRSYFNSVRSKFQSIHIQPSFTYFSRPKRASVKRLSDNANL